MSKAVEFYKEYPLGHLAFLTAKDMSYFTVDVMEVIQKYSPSKQYRRGYRNPKNQQQL